ncbi:MAG TPA: GPP34 family phosphoprotein [Actinomycetales bacterium]|nr:GPP34 family phosphoprotein [Actinomycetales bacterium]
MLLGEDLLLLLTDDHDGTSAVSGEQLGIGLGGAHLLELVLLGRVDVAAAGEPIREGRLVVRDGASTSDPLLDRALATVAERVGKRPTSTVTALGKGQREALYERLVARGVLRAERAKILGIFPRNTWPAEDATHENAVRERIVSALRSGSTTDPRTGALVSLLHSLRAIDKVFDPDAVGMPRKAMTRAAEQISAGDWASKAVRQAIDSANAALIAVVASTTAAAAGSS